MTMARRFSSCTANDRHGTFLDGEGNENEPKVFEDFVDYTYKSVLFVVPPDLKGWNVV
jgi:hypothetical protein